MVTCATRIALVLALSLAVACGKSKSSSDEGPDAIGDTPLAQIDYGTEDAPAADSQLPADTLEDGTSDAEPCTIVTSEYGFRNNCDGTVTDTKTGWIWEKSFQQVTTLPEALKACSDSRTAGKNDWRVPTIDELRSLILGCPASAPTGACPVHALTTCTDETCRNASCDGCGNGQGPVTNPLKPASHCYMDASFDWYCNLFWSGTQVKAKVTGDKRSWYVTFYDARIDVPPTMPTSSSGLRCVRGP